MDAIDETLEQRGSVYGDYDGGCRLRVDIMNLIRNRHKAVNGKAMPLIYEEYIRDIVNKLSRLATSPNHIDTWHDIAGYAKLTEEILHEIQEPPK